MGGIGGPLLFGRLGATGSRGPVALGFVVGAVVMAIGGIAEIFAGVKTGGKSLESSAAPLSAAESDTPGEAADTSDTGQRIQRRVEDRARRERAGARRYVPGPGSNVYAPAVAGTTVSAFPRSGEPTLDREIELIGRAVDDRGVLDRDDLARQVGARLWGPGRFRNALREAVAEGRVRRVSRTAYGRTDQP